MLSFIRSTLLMGPVFIGLLALPVGVKGDATTQPAASGAGAGGNSQEMRPGVAYVIKRLKDAAGGLDLSDEQKPKVDAVFQHITQEGLSLSDEIGTTPPGQRYQKLIDFSKQIRGELAGVLNDDQVTALDSKIGPALQPRAGGNFGGNNRPGQAGSLVDNLQQAIAKLDLTDDQKQQIKDVFTQAKQKLADIRAKGGDIQAGLQDVRQFVRQKMQGILSPDQMQTLGDAMRQYQQQRGGGARQPGGAKAPVAETKPEDLNSDGPEIGAAAPDVQVVELNGQAFSPSKYKGRVVVMEFGSLSCPVFRQHVAEMEKLKQAEGGRAFFVFVYTREAFPAGNKDVERNHTDGIAVADATTLDERKAQAEQTQKTLHITLTMAVDPMDNSASSAFGAFPNGAVVIGKDGTIAERQEWTNPGTLKIAIDDAVAQTVSPMASAH